MVARHMRRMISSLKTWAVRLKGWRGKRQRLWLRLLGYYLALGLVPVLLVDLVVLNAARDAIEEAVLDSRREMAHRTAAEIARIFSASRLRLATPHTNCGNRAAGCAHFAQKSCPRI